jgi:hypothetical protein
LKRTKTLTKGKQKKKNEDENEKKIYYQLGLKSEIKNNETF